MNLMAQELNDTLEQTVVYRLLSRMGRRLYFPKGIVSQSMEAGRYAHTFNATAGMAYAEGEPMVLPSIRRLAPELSAGDLVAYSSTAGEEELRRLWLSEMQRKNPGLAKAAISNPIVVPGITNGIAQTADLFIDENDTVIIPDMYWGNYRLIFEERRGASVRTYPLFAPGGGLDLAALRHAIDLQPTGSKVILLFNFPNNPTGYSPSAAEAEQIVEIIRSTAKKGYDVLVICDDAYFGLFYEPETYRQSLFAPLSNLHENVLAVKADGPTKEDFAWGFRVAFLTFGAKGLKKTQYEALQKKLMGAIRSSISNSSRPAQSMLIRAMSSGTYREEKEKRYAILQERYLAVKEILRETPPPVSLEPLPFNSGYFMSFRTVGKSAEKLRKELLHTDGVGTISIHDTYLRIAYASIDTEDLRRFYDLLYRAAERLPEAASGMTSAAS
jgi:aspartate/methionine/tyrosine aminotransferase